METRFKHRLPAHANDAEGAGGAAKTAQHWSQTRLRVRGVGQRTSFSTTSQNMSDSLSFWGPLGSLRGPGTWGPRKPKGTRLYALWRERPAGSSGGPLVPWGLGAAVEVQKNKQPSRQFLSAASRGQGFSASQLGNSNENYEMPSLVSGACENAREKRATGQMLH